MNSRTKLSRILSSKHFRTSFLVLFITWVIVFCILSVVLFLRTRITVQTSLQNQLNDMVLSLSEIFDTTRTNAVSLGSMSSVQAAILLPAPDLDKYITMSNDISSTMDAYPYLSVDLFMENTQKIYVSQRGMYTYDDYAGQDIIQLIKQPQPHEFWLLGRDYSTLYGNPSVIKCITYLKRLPVYSSEPRGYVAFHLPFSHIEEAVAEAMPIYPGTLIVSFNGGVLYSNLSDYSAGEALPSQEELSQQSHSLISTSNLSSEIQCSFLLPKSYLYRQANDIFSQLFPAMGLGFIFIILFSMGYSLVLLRPIEQLLNQIGAPSYEGDEFERFSHTVSGLSSCIDLLSGELQRNLPFIQERYILDLIVNYTEVPSVKTAYEEAGLSFPYSQFAVIVAGFPPSDTPLNYSAREQRRLILRTEAEKHFSSLGLVYSAVLTDDQLLFLINSNAENFSSCLAQACHVFSETIAPNISPTAFFSVGMCPPGDPVPYHAYLQARNHLTFSSDAESEGSLLLLDDTARAIPAVDTKTTSHIIELVLSHDLDSLQQYLEQLFQKSPSRNTNAEDARRLSLICMASAVSRMIELELDPVAERAASAIKKLSLAGCTSDCVEVLLQYFSTVVNTEKKLPDDAAGHVDKAIQFIQAHYSEPLSIPQIAEHVALNPVYLNKLFKLSTGKTISDYLNFYRVEIAKTRLANTDLSLTAISEQLGYNDVRSLTRYFKKYHGISPLEYRQNFGN